MVLYFNLHFWLLVILDIFSSVYWTSVFLGISLLFKMDINRKMRISFVRLYLVAVFIECVYTGHWRMAEMITFFLKNNYYHKRGKLDLGPIVISVLSGLSHHVHSISSSCPDLFAHTQANNERNNFCLLLTFIEIMYKIKSMLNHFSHLI